jgi:glycerate 2-kinase
LLEEKSEIPKSEIKMHVLIAPNAFKNSLNAADAARAIAQGLKLSRLSCTTTCFPIADGGDGTGSLIIEACGGDIINNEVHDPLGRKINASFGLIDKRKTAVIEMANASGVRLLKKDELNPMLTSSFGTGELIKSALDQGVNRVIIAMGGSATVDGGCGILNALGIRFLDAKGKTLLPKPVELINLADIDTSLLDKRILACDVVILCDVNNKLLGGEGAARVFGPQKGATAADIPLLEGFLSRLASIAREKSGLDITEIKNGGAAGGATAGLHAFLNAKLVNGIEYFLKLTNFDGALQTADLLITGEGAIDHQTLQGKGPYGAALMAKDKGIPVIGVAGSVPLEPDEELLQYFNVLIPINNELTDLPTALGHTRQNLIRTAKSIGDLLAIKGQ